MKSQFSTFDITKALGIPRERLKDWMNNRFVKPTKSAKGQGTKAIFTLMDVYGIALFQDLIRRGFKRDMASLFVKKFMERGEAEKTDYILFRYETRGRDMKIVTSMTVGSGSWAIELESGSIGQYDSKLRIPFIPIDPREIKGEKIDIRQLKGKGGWNHLHLVNFKKLREKVNAELSELD